MLVDLHLFYADLHNISNIDNISFFFLLLLLEETSCISQFTTLFHQAIFLSDPLIFRLVPVW